MDFLGLYMISNHIILYVDVLGSIMEYGVLGQLYCRSVVINKGVDFSFFSYNSSSIFPSHTISFVASTTVHILCFYCQICWNLLFVSSLRDSYWSKTHCVFRSGHPCFFVTIEVWMSVPNEFEVFHLSVLEFPSSTLELFLQQTSVLHKVYEWI